MFVKIVVNERLNVVMIELMRGSVKVLVNGRRM